MTRGIRIAILVLAIFMATGTVFAADNAPRAAWPAYAFSILLGFGSGQYYMGTDGLWFTVGDVAGLGLILGGGIYALTAAGSALGAAANGSYTTAATTAEGGVLVAYGIIVVGSIVWGVSRIWEIVDTVLTAPKLMSQGKLAVAPVIEAGPEGTTVALSFKY